MFRVSFSNRRAASANSGHRLLLATFAMAPVTVNAQAPRLAPVDFVVAGVPGNQPYIDIPEDTVRIRQILGAPKAVERHEFQPGDSLTTWFYDGLEVAFGGISRVGISLTTRLHV